MNHKTTRIRVRCAAAVFLAAALVPAFVTAQETRPAGPAGGTRIEQARPRTDLGLTAEQKKALEEFRKARGEERTAFREKMSKLRDEMRELAKDPKANQAGIDALIDKTAGLRAERQKAAFRARAERDKIFTPEQLEKLKSLRSRVAGRAGLAGRGMMGPGRFSRLGLGPRRMARLRALRHRLFLRWRRW